MSTGALVAQAVEDVGSLLAAGAPAACSRRGRRWLVEWGRASALVEHSVGMLHLAVLLANPEVEVPAADLVAGVGRLREVLGAPGRSAQPLLDSTAVREYRQRLRELDDAENRAEQDWLLAELSAATTTGGRPRHFTDNAERARIAVGKAIRRAIVRISNADAAIGEHLRDTVHTGIRCAYRP